MDSLQFASFPRTGIDESIDSCLGVAIPDRPARYRGRAASKRLSGAPPRGLEPGKLVGELAARIELNSRALATHAPDLGWRSIASIRDTADHMIPLAAAVLRCASNQWMVLQGADDGSFDGEAPLILAERCSERSWKLIVLGREEETPIVPAMRILEFGLVLRQLSLSTVRHFESSVTRELCESHAIDLRVLAERGTYVGYSFEWLAEAISLGLENLCALPGQIAPRMTYGFEVLPANYSVRGGDREIMSFLERRTPIYAGTSPAPGVDVGKSSSECWPSTREPSASRVSTRDSLPHAISRPLGVGDWVSHVSCAKWGDGRIVALGIGSNVRVDFGAAGSRTIRSEFLRHLSRGSQGVSTRHRDPSQPIESGWTSLWNAPADAQTLLRLRVSPEQAIHRISSIPHASFRSGIQRHWQVDPSGLVRAQSICWLYCWGKTGQSSSEVARNARSVFGKIFNRSFQWIDARVPHEWAQRARYMEASGEFELLNWLARDV
ncbi:hypothetical protein MK489_00370 [Myxococcota bacterium]|nr:hypothetical protein [Myxococcota bacterium]